MLQRIISIVFGIKSRVMDSGYSRNWSHGLIGTTGGACRMLINIIDGDASCKLIYLRPLSNSVRTISTRWLVYFWCWISNCRYRRISTWEDEYFRTIVHRRGEGGVLLNDGDTSAIRLLGTQGTISG